MPKLTDSELAANVRERNREAVRKLRERQKAAGQVTVSMRIPAELKTQLEELARQYNISLGEILRRALLTGAAKAAENPGTERTVEPRSTGLERL